MSVTLASNAWGTASGLTWLILTFYVPLLWVSLGLIVWQLYSRRQEPLASKHAQTTPQSRSHLPA